ncbi:MAG: tRNA (guanosine(46)-N7)-methyltransferase TrmB [Actinobacteria bacterium]|nr:tRNA (guanosine(46)-N7)-methyltransferase TrmB [Actinomycetota bacterium]
MERPSVRSYSIRGSRITQAQRAAKDELQAIYGIAVEEKKVNLKEIFPTSEKIIMEIGFGMGEATAIIAKNHPNNAYIAIDVHPPGIGKLLGRIVENDLKNLRVIEDDVHIVLPHMFEDESLDAIHLYFPDPWPKMKHNKRRIVKEGFISLIHPKLKKGGYIHIATDWVPYAISMQEVFAASALFTGGVIEKPESRPVTRFEGQGIDKDHQVTDLMYFRK